MAFFEPHFPPIKQASWTRPEVSKSCSNEKNSDFQLLKKLREARLGALWLRG